MVIQERKDREHDSQNLQSRKRRESSQLRTFTNPLLPRGADPWFIYNPANQYYYYSFAGNPFDYDTYTGSERSCLHMARSRTITGMKDAVPRRVWTSNATDCLHVGVPELHFWNGDSVIYASMADGGKDDHRSINTYCIYNLYQYENICYDQIYGIRYEVI